MKGYRDVKARYLGKVGGQDVYEFALAWWAGKARTCAPDKIKASTPESAMNMFLGPMIREGVIGILTTIDHDGSEWVARVNQDGEGNDEPRLTTEDEVWLRHTRG